MSRFKASGYVIKGSSFGESSRVITIFTLEKGKLKCLAKGTKKATIKKGGALQLFSQISCNIYQKENVELATLTDTDVMDDFAAISADPAKFGYCSAYCEIIDKSISDNQPIPELYDLTGELFNWMQKCSGNSVAVLFWSAFLKTLAILGYQPRLTECVVCGRQNKGRAAYYDPDRGGIICSKDLIPDGRYGKLSSLSLKTLQDFLAKPLSELSEITCPEKTLKEAGQFIMTFARYHAGLRQNLKSFKFLSQLKKE
jgi:DNA repair protein RecO (recombination protein O)